MDPIPDSTKIIDGMKEITDSEYIRKGDDRNPTRPQDPPQFRNADRVIREVLQSSYADHPIEGIVLERKGIQVALNETGTLRSRTLRCTGGLRNHVQGIIQAGRLVAAFRNFLRQGAGTASRVENLERIPLGKPIQSGKHGFLPLIHEMMVVLGNAFIVPIIDSSPINRLACKKLGDISFMV